MRLLNLASLVLLLVCLLSATLATPFPSEDPFHPRLPKRGSQSNPATNGPQPRLIKGFKRKGEKPAICPSSAIDHYREHVFYAGNAYCPDLAIDSKVGLDGIVLWKTGNGNNAQRVFIAYSPRLGIVVSHEGTNKTSFASVANDLGFELVAPWKGLEWLAPDVKIDKQFQETWDDSAQQILAEVQKAKETYPDAGIVTTGHSLGAATALLGALHLNHNLNMPVNTVVFGMPRVGNDKFADAVDKLLPDQKHIVHSRDPVTHLPGKSFGFRHPSGEVWIANEKDDPVYDCAGQENSLCSDSVTFLDYKASDHTGPYFGVSMDCVTKP